MRAIDSNTLKALNGSRAGDRIVAYSWYNGQLAYPDPIPVESWKMSWDDTRQIQTLSLAVKNADGKLAPWLFSDPLGVGGARLQVMYQVGGAGTVNLGWYRINHNDVNESWRVYNVPSQGTVNAGLPVPRNKKMVFVSGGAVIDVAGQDLARVIKNASLIAPESPSNTATALSEIRRLLKDLVYVQTLPGVVDVNVPMSVVYEKERLDAVEDLCARMYCRWRMNGDGWLEIYPIGAQTPVWTVEGGPEGVLIGIRRSQDLDGLYSVAVSEGTKKVTLADGTEQSIPIVATAVQTGGDLAAYGPHGFYPVYHSSPLITTQSQAQADANTVLASQMSGQVVDLRVECLPNPALQQGDWVTVANPVVDGTQLPIVGRVKTMELSGAAAVDRMVLTVTADYATVQKAISGVDRA